MKNFEKVNFDFNQLTTSLVNSKFQTENNALFQTIANLIKGISELQKVVLALAIRTDENETEIDNLSLTGILNVTIVDDNYSVSNQDDIVQITVALKTMILPSAVGITGKVFTIDNSSAGNNDIASQGIETIEGINPLTIIANNSVSVYSDGSNYRIF